MRLTLRFILPLACILAVIAFGLAPLIDSLTYKWFLHDVDIRSQLVANTLQDQVESILNEEARPFSPSATRKLEKLFETSTEGKTTDERLTAIVLCAQPQHPGEAPAQLFKTRQTPSVLTCDTAQNLKPVFTERSLPYHASIVPLRTQGANAAYLVIVHDLQYVQARSTTIKHYLGGIFTLIGIILSFTNVFVAKRSWESWLASMRLAIRRGSKKPLSHMVSPEFRPLVKDLRLLMRDLESTRRPRDEVPMGWSPKTLKNILQQELMGDEVLIVSNREPYIHSKKDGVIEAKFPASGLVTALEPIMRACSGTWIAHGSGNADRETVDSHDRVRVPPNDPSYQIRRVWLTDEEEKGYYYGFANEGLWALCHIAHVRPTFRSSDFAYYREVNERFARAVVEEAKTDDPVVLVQDYHFALLPRMIKQRLPKATVITFWHIPFPNSEVFGICPWREEILEGLLGSDILGFHTRFHCNNFLDSVDRFLESRIDRDVSTVSHQHHLTAVKHYPISIEYPVKWMSHPKSIYDCRARVRQENGLSENVCVGVGVDRLDYTKGILERFNAVERLLELYPKWIGKFSFVQIAAPSRSSIEEYQHFESRVRKLAARINERFGYPVICLKIEHHGPEDVYDYYRGSDLCFVSSLHDGMNLVAKEFVASRDDYQGVLILSQFTGAARELPEALIVNPYDADQCAGALNTALEMPFDEQAQRIRSMKGFIEEFNVYRWAGRMLLDAARLRQKNRLLQPLGSNHEASL